MTTPLPAIVDRLRKLPDALGKRMSSSRGRRLGWQLAPIVGVQLWLVIAGLWLGVNGPNGAQVNAALMTAMGTALAASVAAMVWEYKAHLDREIKESKENRARRERVLDTVLAVKADIASDLPLLEAVFSQKKTNEQLQKFKKRIVSKDPHPLPRSAQSSKRLILGAIEKDISVLPSKLIAPILSYYKIDMDMGILLEKMTSGAFDTLRVHRQREQLISYFSLGDSALGAATTALEAINHWLKEKAPEHQNPPNADRKAAQKKSARSRGLRSRAVRRTPLRWRTVQRKTVRSEAVTRSRPAE